MDPYRSPPFLGPFHVWVQIDYTQFKTLPAGQQTATVFIGDPLPPYCRLAGITVAETTNYKPFADPTGTTFFLSVYLNANLIASGPTLISVPLTMPQSVLTVVGYGHPIGGERPYAFIQSGGVALSGGGGGSLGGGGGGLGGGGGGLGGGGGPGPQPVPNPGAGAVPGAAAAGSPTPAPPIGLPVDLNTLIAGHVDVNLLYFVERGPTG
jgi:hypothetical protein